MDKLLDSDDLISMEHSQVEDLINVCYVTRTFKDATRYLSNKIGFEIDFDGFIF
ncbi:hypothetical protein [Bacillus ndiopicus]|uniref:hypothetical protein n=1 Tax=Bacillus ndiopicus TaxID=1347368 RepID=UPI0012B5F417|nr:hypothetical protein [Bacillus ndiopicus]